MLIFSDLDDFNGWSAKYNIYRERLHLAILVPIIRFSTFCPLFTTFFQFFVLKKVAKCKGIISRKCSNRARRNKLPQKYIHCLFYILEFLYLELKRYFNFHQFELCCITVFNLKKKLINSLK